MKYLHYIFIILLIFPSSLFSQSFPDPNQNISMLMLYGKDAPASLGDPDHIMDVFFLVPGEKGKPLDIQILESKDSQIKNNLITIRLLDQDGLPLMPEPWSISRWDMVE